jgi:hypothetical protein
MPWRRIGEWTFNSARSQPQHRVEMSGQLRASAPVWRSCSLLTYFIVQDIIWKADCHSACQTSCFLYGTQRFITVFTIARHWTLSWASRMQFASSIPVSPRPILMLSSHLRLGLPSGLFPPLLTWLHLPCGDSKNQSRSETLWNIR